MKLSLTKKSDAQPVVLPLWHPNFRNFEKLPDTKVVRTTFFINTAAVSLAAFLLIWTGNRELQINTLNGQIADAQAEIDREKPQSNEALRLAKVFTDEETKLMEAVRFVQTPVLPIDFVRELGTTLPKDIQIEMLEIRRPEGNNTPASCTLRAMAAGTKDQASGSASNYVEALRTNPKLATIFESVAISSLSPDARSGALGFEVILKFKTEGKKP